MQVMPIRDSEDRAAETDASVEPAQAEPEAAKQQFSSEGDIPAVAGAVPAAAAAPSASELAFDGAPKQASGDLSHLDRGVHHWEAYQHDCEAAGKPEKFQNEWKAGHTAAAGWIQPYEHRAMNDWQLKKGTSASTAIKAWMDGPTIADYRAAGVANDLDELRDEMGDQKFDVLFGSANDEEDAAIPESQRLRVSAAAYGVPLIDQMKAIAREYDDKAAGTPEEPAPAPVVEARVEERPQEQAALEQEPVVVAQELAAQQQDRELA
jgi:hypothetical protein